MSYDADEVLLTFHTVGTTFIYQKEAHLSAIVVLPVFDRSIVIVERRSAMTGIGGRGSRERE